MIWRRDRFKRIAIIKPCCIGDCVMALPTIDAIVSANPCADIEVLVGQHSRAIFDTRAERVRVRTIPQAIDPGAAIPLLRQIRSRRYDLIVMLDRSRAFGLVARLGAPGRFAAPIAMAPETRHESDVYRDVARLIGVPVGDEPPIIESNRQSPGPYLPTPTPYVVMHPGGGRNPGSVMDSKRWPEQSWRELIARLATRARHIVLTGGPDEVDLCQRVSAEFTDQVTVLAGRLSLRQAIDVVGSATLFVGPDTGLSHVAAATGTPTVAIFGPTNPSRYRPIGRRVAICAAPGSRRVPDVDLRWPRPAPPDARTNLVSVDAVRAAIERVEAGAS